MSQVIPSSPLVLQPGNPEPLVAFLDIGTNSVRMLLARFDADHSFSIVTQQKEVVRLGEGEFQGHQLQPVAIRRAVQVCTHFVQMARANGVRDIVAVATSATREAENRAFFLRKLEREAGLDVRVISGKEEARLIYLGVVSGLNLGEKRALFIDIGGGSTEVIIGTQNQYDFLDSLKLGAIRLTSQFFTAGDPNPVDPALYQRLKRYVRTTSVRTLQQLKLWRTDVAIGSSGSICNLAEIVTRMFLKRGWKRDDVITLDQIKQTSAKLCDCTLAERMQLPGINPERADIIVAGAAIIETLMEELEVSELRVSERGLREGLPLDYISRMEHSPSFELRSFRERSVFQLGRACRFDEPHARKVASLACEMFDDALKLGLHDYGEWEKELLEYASLLHDIGTFLSYSNHRGHSYYFIRNADLLGFDQTEIAIIAAIALFHSKGMPSFKDKQFDDLSKRDRKIIRSLCIFLRIAESLDRSHTGVVTHAYLKRVTSELIRLEIVSTADCQLELWGMKKHEPAFEQIFQQKLTFNHIRTNEL